MLRTISCHSTEDASQNWRLRTTAEQRQQVMTTIWTMEIWLTISNQLKTITKSRLRSLIQMKVWKILPKPLLWTFPQLTLGTTHLLIRDFNRLCKALSISLPPEGLMKGPKEIIIKSNWAIKFWLQEIWRNKGLKINRWAESKTRLERFISKTKQTALFITGMTRLKWTPIDRQPLTPTTRALFSELIPKWGPTTTPSTSRALKMNQSLTHRWTPRGSTARG